MKFLSAVFAGLFFLFTLSFSASAEIPTRYGFGIYAGNSYSPESDITLVQAQWMGLWDYDSVWFYSVPDDLAFKVEANAGGAYVGDTIRTAVSLNMYAMYYIRALETEHFSPYFDAGIGIIYTDYQVEGMGLRTNFNPQLGLGAEYTTNSGAIWFGNIRMHHISNGGLDDDNTGLNSLAFSIGKYF